MLAAPVARGPYAGGTLAPLGAGVSTTEPALSAEVELDGVFTDVTAYLRAATVKRGRQRALDKVGAGTMTWTLSNQDRHFDPAHNTAFAELRPGTRLRLQATWDGTTYPIFVGYLDRITQHFGNTETPNDAVAVWEASDGLAVLAAANLGSPLEVTMADHTPRMWLRLGEKTGTVAFDRSGNGHHGTLYASPNFVAGLLDEDSDGAVEFPAPNAGWMGLSPGSLPIGQASWSMSFMLNVPAIPAFTQYLFYAFSIAGGLRIYTGATGRIAIEVLTATGSTGAIVTTSGDVLNGNSYQVNVVAAAGQTMKLYLGDVDVSSGASGTNHTLLDDTYVVGLSDQEDVTLDEIITFDYALSADQLQGLEFAAGAWVNDSGSDRITRVLDAVGWPAADRQITSDFDDFLKGTGLATTALAHLQAIETTVEGRLFVARDGTLTLLGRDEHLTAPYDTSQATFGDQAGQLGYHEHGPLTQDWDLVTNVVRRVNGESTVVASDATSIATYGTRDTSDAAEVESLYLTLDAEYDLANYRLAHYSEPVDYIEGLTILGRSAPDDLWPQVLGRELSDRITFARTPQGVGSPIETDTIVEGITHEIGPKRWVTRFAIDAIAAQRYFLFDDTGWDAEEWRFAA